MTHSATYLAAALVLAIPTGVGAHMVPSAPSVAPSPQVILIQDSKEEARTALQAFLPEPMEGWTRTLVLEADAELLPMLGDGYMVEADYQGADGTVNLAMMVDTPMIAQMAPMLGNPAMMAILGEAIEIDGRSFVRTETHEVVGLIDERILVSVSGNRINGDDVIAYIEQIDFEGLESFNR